MLLFIMIVIYILFLLFLLIFSFCVMVDVSMPLFTGHTLNITSKLIQRLGLKRLANLFELKLKRGDDEYESKKTF